MLRILMATDFSQQSQIAFMRAIKVAIENEAWLRVVHASETELSAEDGARIQSISDRLRALTPPELDAHVALLAKKRLDAILEEVVTFAPNLIVLGSHKRTRLRDTLFGTFATQLLARTDVPILIARAADCRPYRRILAAIDDGDTAAQVLRLATSVATARHLYVVHACDAHGGRPVMVGGAAADSAARSAVERIVNETAPHSETLQVHLDIKLGDPFKVIEREVRQIEPDLLVLGTHGRKGVDRILFESLAEDALAYFELDTLVVQVSDHEAREPDRELVGRVAAIGPA